MIFTLYGDYIRHYENDIWIGSLIELLEAFDHNAQAVRAAMSRMYKQNWVSIRKEGNKSYYSLTKQGVKRMDQAAGRIYQIEPGQWDGKWRMLLYNIPEEKRHIRDELRKELSWSGLGLLSNGIWITPNDLSSPLQDIIEKYEIEDFIHFFLSENIGPQSNEEIIKECWDLDYINQRYEEFIKNSRGEYEETRLKMENGELTDKECFVKRTLLVHYYRKSLFVNPGLPKELLPDKWVGEDAAKLFTDYYRILAKPANDYFEKVYAKGFDHIERHREFTELEHPFIQ